MALRSLVDELRQRGNRRMYRLGSEVPLSLAVRQYQGSKAPRLVASLSQELGAAIGAANGKRVDVLFDRDDSTGLLKLRDDGYAIVRPVNGRRWAAQLPFIPRFVPDFGEDGYEPEEVEVKDEGVLFAFPAAMWSFGRNGTAQP